MNTFLPLAFPSRLASACLVFVIFRMSNRSKKLWKFEPATFKRIKPIVLGFVRISRESGSNPRTIGLIRPKVAFENFRDFPNVESVEKMWNFETATFERIKPIVLGFVQIRWKSGSNLRTIGLIRPKVAFEIFVITTGDPNYAYLFIGRPLITRTEGP